MMRKEILPLITVGIIFISLSLFKSLKVCNSNYFTKDENCIFWTESAFQYRYAKMVSSGIGIPVVDKKLEFPDGYEVKKFHPTLMESVSGYLYRITPVDIPFHLFLIFLMGFYSSTSIIAVYLFSSYIWKNKWIGMFSSILFSVCLTSSMTVLNIAYEFQDFTLGLIFFHIFFHIKAESLGNNESRSWGFAFLSGVFLFMAFSSWHLTQFYYVIFLIYILFRIISDENYNFYPFYIISIFAFLCGFLIPVLKYTTFLISMPMLFNYSLLTVSFLKIKRRWKFLGSLFLLLALFLIFKSTGISTHESGFNAMLSKGIMPLLVAKIKSFGFRPLNAKNLTWETLVLWVHPLNTPSLSWTIKSFGFLLPLGIYSSIMIAKDLIRRKISKSFIPILFFFFAFLFSYLLFERIDVFLLVFLSILSTFIIKKYSVKGTILLSLLLIPNLVFLLKHKVKPNGPNRNYLLQTIRFIKEETEEDAPILTHFAYSPSILMWTNRPVIIHPKFESYQNVLKVKKFENLLFKEEDEFYKFARKYYVKYFLLSSDMLLRRDYTSIRYRTKNHKITKKSIIYKFHFHPEELKSFTLIYSNPHYRLYKVNYPDAPSPEFNFEYYRIYDERNFDLKKLGIR
jgi:hypothetical protein